MINRHWKFVLKLYILLVKNKGLYQNLYSNLEKNITKKLKDNNNAVDSKLCKGFITSFSGCDQEHVSPFMKLF